MFESSAGYQALLRQAEENLVPISMTIELTERCGFRCIHCFFPDHQRPDLLDTARVLRLLEELAEMGTLFLTLTGGEMLLRHDWLEISRRARELDFCLNLFTNGALVSESVADAIAALGASVEVSLYSIDQQVFEHITQVPGSLARTIAGIERLTSRGVTLRLKAPVMSVNLNDIEAVAEYARSIGAELRTDPRLLGRNDGDVAPIGLRVPPSDLAEYYRSLWSAVQLPVASPAQLALDEQPCAAGTRIATVSAQGEVLACNLLRRSAGNLSQGSFRDIWLGSEWLNQLRSIHRSDLPECASCRSLSYCHRCPAQALAEDGDLLGLSSWSCDQAAALEDISAGDR